MTDIASLGFSIDTSEVRGAESDLDRLNATGAKTEAAAKGVGNAWSGVGSKVSGANGAIKSTSTAVQQGNAALKAQQAELGKLLGQINPVVAALGRLDDQEEKLRKFRSKGLVDAETFNDYKVKIDQARTSLTAVDGTIRKTGVSSAQTAQALRQLPAQFTDIFTSLAGGQSPLLVLIQQGGQIKDSFGGIGNTFQVLGEKVRGFFGASAASAAGLSNGVADATALSSALSGVVEQQAAMAAGAGDASEGLTDIADSANASAEAVGNAQTAFAGASTIGFATVAWLAAAAAAAVALAVAYKQGSDESTAYNKALVLTGNIAGTNAGQLSNMAKAIDETVGTQRQAAAALAEIAGTGKFAAEQIQGVATAAVAMNDATGKAISETVQEFSRLADEPAAASAKLNEQYNYLTASIYQQITALEEQGDAAGAAQLAIDTFAEAMNQRSSEIEGNLGLIEKSWEGIKSAAAEAWDEMLGIGRTKTPEERINELTQTGVNAKEVGSSALLFGLPGGAINFGKQLYNQLSSSEEGRSKGIADAYAEIQARDEKSWQEGLRAKLEKDGVEAQKRIDSLTKETLTNAQKRQKALLDLDKDLAKIRAANPDDTRLADASVKKLQDNIAQKYKDPKAPKVPKVKAFSDDAATQLLLTLKKQEASLQEQLSSETKLTAEQKKRAEFEAEIATLKTKDILTADQKSLLANQDAIRAQLDQNVALADTVRLQSDNLKLQERSAQIQASIQASSENRQEQQQRNLDAFGQGRQAQEKSQAAASIFKEFRRYQDQLTKNTPKDLLGSDEYQSEREKIAAGLRGALDEHEAYYARLEQLQGSWQIGASQAFADYSDQARDISGQTADIIGSTLDSLTQGIGDNTAQALIYGEDLRESMRGLSNDILTGVISSLTQMGVQYGINAALEIAGVTAVTTAKTAAAGTVAAAELAAITTTTAASISATSAVAAAQVPAAAATTTAWAPAATVASIGSFGSAAAIGLAAVVAAIALSKGFKTGGYTGNGGTSDVAGVVHGKEFVFDAAATSRIGVDKLESMRAGRDIATASARQSRNGMSGASSGASNNQTINMSFPGITDSREAKKATAQAARELGELQSRIQRYG